MLVMDRHNLRPDEWDNRIVVRMHPQIARLLLSDLLLFLQRWNNCVQMASIVCDLFSICVPELKDLAKILDCVAHCSYAATQGCMTVRSSVLLAVMAILIQLGHGCLFLRPKWTWNWTLASTTTARKTKP